MHVYIYYIYKSLSGVSIEARRPRLRYIGFFCRSLFNQVVSIVGLFCMSLSRVSIEARRPRLQNPQNRYGVATISRLLKITGLFCRISSLL